MSRKTKPAGFQLLVNEQRNQLGRQGYADAPKGRPCRLCNTSGSLLLRTEDNGASETVYCTSCHGTHTVRLR